MSSFIILLPNQSGAINYQNELRGKPYQLKIGNSLSSKIPYANPDDFLTFRWFKLNVMCPEQPWICEQ